MKIVSFKYLGQTDGIKFGEVETVTGFFFKKTEKRQVFLEHLHWRFLDTGEYTPDVVVENLYTITGVQKKIKELSND